MCNEAVTNASVVGREFDFALLLRLAEDITEDELSTALEEAVKAHLVEELSTLPGRYHFSHSLIQQALAEELSTTRRVRLHARIAEALESNYGPDAEAQAAELAHHFAEAQTVLGAEKLVQYSLLAVEKALATYAYGEALDHFQRALSAKDEPSTGTVPTECAETAAALFGLGRAQLATLDQYQLGDAVTSLLQRALDYYINTGDVARAAAVAEYPLLQPARYLLKTTLVDRVLPLVPPDSLVAGRLLSQYGLVIGGDQGDYQGAQEAFERGLAIARREGDTALEMRTLSYAALMDLFHVHFQEGLEKYLRAVALAQSVGDPRAEVEARWYTAVIQYNLGQPEEARRTVTAGLALAGRLQHREWQAYHSYGISIYFRAIGEWDSAREYGDRGLQVSPRFYQLLYMRLCLEYEVGEFAAGGDYLNRLLEIAQSRPAGSVGPMHAATSFAVALSGRIAGAEDRFDVAEELAENVLSSSRSIPPLTANFARAGLAVLAVQPRDADAAADQYGTLQSARGTTISTATVTSIDRVLGLLAHTMGNPEQAATHFADALTFSRKAGFRAGAVQAGEILGA